MVAGNGTGPGAPARRSSARAVAVPERGTWRGVKDERPAAKRLAAVGERLHEQAVPLLVLLLVAGGLLLRWKAAQDLSLQVDEPATLLAAAAIAEGGVPVLPSGTFYLHGAVLSYLLAPLAWLGYDSLADLGVLRLVSAAVGSVAIYLTYRLGRLVTGSPWLALLAAAFVALDPVAVQWGGHIRMYALLQALTVALVWVFLRALVLPPGGRRPALAAVVALFWVATFTHSGIVMLWPPLVLVAFARYGRALGGRQRGVAAALAVSLVAPVVYVGLNVAFGPAARTSAAAASGSLLSNETFLDPETLVRPSIWVWRSLFRDDYYAGLMPALLTILAGSLVGRYFLAEPPITDRADRQGVGALLGFFWLPILAIGLFTGETQGRYVLNIYPFGLILTALAIGNLARPGAVVAGGGKNAWVAPASALVATAVIATNLIQGLVWRFGNPIVDADYVAAMEFVAANREADDPIVTALPAPAYLALGEDAPILFLAGAADGERVGRYALPGPDGVPRDYWVGAEAVTSIPQFCQLMIDRPDAWVVVDEERLINPYVFAGPMTTAIRGAVDPVYEDPSGVRVLRPVDPATWSAQTLGACGLNPAG